MSILFGISLLTLSAISVYFRLLTASGSLAALMTGSFVYFSFGWKGIVLLGLFFMTSSLLTKWKKEFKLSQNTVNTEDKKGRNAGQVFANGGVGILAAAGYLWTQDAVWYIIFAGAMATAAADTWASEIGVLSKKKPFHLKEWRYTEPGLSGAVSVLGIMAAISGALFISISFHLLNPFSVLLVFILMTAGFLGNLADSFIGAWFEQRYRCEVCKWETEAAIHCDRKTVRIFGLPWVTNDLVNFISTLIGALLAGGLYLWLL
jgi:uncharacterized protein (TIGR00297 family)